MSDKAAGSAGKKPIIETRAIEYIPLRERHGKAWQVTPVWVSSSANLAGLAVATFGVFSGLNLLWSVVAIAAGGLFGTFFASFHASQGPQLGLPQLIQSRPQFGYVGALLIFIIALLVYLGMSVFAIVLMGDTAKLLLGIPAFAGMVVSTLVAVVLAVVGYNLVHRASRWTFVVFVPVLLTMLIGLPIVVDLPAVNASAGGFNLSGFLALAGGMAASVMAWAPYVSDYTRYLRHLSLRASFFGTYIGMSVTAIVVTGLAAVCFATFPKLDVVSAIKASGDLIFSGFGAIFLIITFLGTIIMVTMNFYGGALTLMSAIDSFRPIRPRPIIRPFWTIVFGVVSFLIALVASGEFVNNYLNFLTILFYLLAPWTAINLVDFFMVRHGKYSIREIFNPHGIYGRWNWRGYTAFTVAVLVMIPFTITAWWKGPIGGALGFDVAPFVGILVAGLTYGLLARSIDLVAERAEIDVADAGLDDEVSESAQPVAVPSDESTRIA